MYSYFICAVNYRLKRKRYYPVSFFQKLIPLIVLTVLFFNLKEAVCQKSMPMVSFKYDSIPIQTSSTFINNLILHNPNPIDLEIEIKTNFEANEFIGLPKRLNLKAGESSEFPLKFFANKRTITHSNQSFIVEVYQRDTLLETGQFKTILANHDDIYLQSPTIELYSSKNLQQVFFQINAYNSSIIPIIYQIRPVDLPNGIKLQDAGKIDTLQALEHHNLSFILHADKSFKEELDQWFNMEFLNQDGQVIASQRFRLLSINNRRNLYSSNYTNVSNNAAHQNKIYYVNNNSSHRTQVFLSGVYKFNKHWKADYELNYNTMWNGRWGLLYNSFIHAGNEKFDIRLGSIYANLNFNLNGKGIKGTYHVKDSRLSAYILDSDMVLFGENANLSPKGFSAGLEYAVGEETNPTSRLIALYNLNHTTKIKSSMIYWQKYLINNTNHQLSTEVSTSHELFFPEQMSANHLGFLITGKYQFNSEDWRFNAQHQFSSPYYVGLSRGVHLIDYVLTRNINDKLSVLGRINYSKTKMQESGRNRGELLDLVRNFSQQSHEIGLQWQLNPRWSTGFNPYYFRQTMTSRITAEPDTYWNSEAWRLKFNLSNRNDAFNTNVIIDQGFAKMDNIETTSREFYSIKINTAIQRKNLTLNSYYQYNPFFITDALLSQAKKSYSLFSVAPRYNFSKLNGKLDFSTAFHYYYYGNSKTNNYVLNGQVRWNLIHQWELSTEVYVGINQLQRILQYNPELGLNNDPKFINGRDPDLFANRQLKIGVNKYFGNKSASKSAKMKFKYYQDTNNNGKQDADETVVPNIQVSINGVAAVSDRKGTVEFTGLKEQAYYPLISHNEGWVVSKKFNQTSIYLLKDISLKIPLIKLERLKGNLTILKEKYLSPYKNLSGIRIYIQDNQGGIYETSTNIHGDFIIYLPADAYRIQVITASLPIKILNNNQQIIVYKNQENSVSFEGINTSRQIDFQKF